VRYLFDDYALDTNRRELSHDGHTVRIEPQAFDLLEYLIRNRDRVVSRDDLLVAIWGGRIVSDSAMATRINAARRAVGDTGKAQRHIKTVPRKGIRFVSIVREEGVGEILGKDVSSRPTTPYLSLPDRPSIAVLAFINMSGDPGQDYFSDGITEDIITDLSRFSELLVIARNSSFQYKGKSVDIRQVGRELGVRYVLEGSIRRARDRIRVSAQLIDATTGAHRWADRYDCKLDDTFAVQDEVTRTIVAALAVHVNKAETERALAKPPAMWLAYDHYLRAAHTLALYNSSFNKAELLQTRRSLDRALAIDPNYARAHAALSRSSIELWVRRWDDDCSWTAAIDGAYQSAREAVRLGPNLSDAHVALGWALSFMRQHEAAITEFKRATQLNPNFTDYYHFAFALLVDGQPAKAIQTLEAHMRLDPFYQPRTPGILGFAYYLLGRYLDALPYLQEAASRAPNHCHNRRYLAATYAQLGQLDRARDEATEALRTEPWFTINQGIFARICKRPEDAKHFSEGLRKAGFPE
jgi:adenylate cyclase